MPSRKVMGWPLRASECLTLSPAEAQLKVEQERKKPSLMKLHAWYESRRQVILAEAPDLDTYMRWLDQAIIEYQQPQVDHYQRLRQPTDANLKRISRKDTWQQLARQKADEVLKKSGIHCQSALQLAMKLCGVADWNPAAKFSFNFTKGKNKKGKSKRKFSISADRLSRFLRTRYSFPHSK